MFWLAVQPDKDAQKNGRRHKGIVSRLQAALHRVFSRPPDFISISTKKPTPLAWTVLIAGLAISLLAFLAAQSVVEREARLKFEAHVNESTAAIEKRVQSYNAGLYALRGLFMSKENVTRLEFRRYVQSVEFERRYPGLVTYNFARRVTRAEKRVYEERVRRESRPDWPDGFEFRIRPEGDRDEYLVVEYTESLSPEVIRFGLGRDIIGYDQHAVERRRAVEYARDSGQLSTSGRPIPGVPGFEKSVAVATRLAVYRPGMPLTTVEQRRHAYIGSVGHSFSMLDMMRDVLAREVLRDVSVQMYDVGSVAQLPSSEKMLLFDSRLLLQEADPARAEVGDAVEARFFAQTGIEAAGRRWSLHFADRSQSSMATQLLLLGTLLGGVVISVLAFILVRSLLGARQRALRAVTGIMHDVNQPLAALTVLCENSTQLLERGDSADVRDNLQMMGQMVERMGRIVGQLGTFARTGSMALEAVSIREVLGNALLLIEAQCREQEIDVKVVQPDFPLRVVADAVRLEQVLMNLLRNAVDAMKEASEKRIVVRVGPSDRHVLVSIQDSGPGIVANVLPHIFEPFYTTKPAGKGLGLGLAMAIATVKNFGGDLQAGRALTGGAQFDLTLLRA